MNQKRNWIDTLERKIGKYAVPDLMKYLSILYVIGTIACYTGFYGDFLALDFSKIFHGQIWRLVTFVVYPPQLFAGSALDIIFVVISISLYFMIGRSLENAWGTFRFNLYYFTGVIACILSGLIAYLTLGTVGIVTTDYVFQTMFLAFAVTFPDVELLLYFIIPIKMKWLGWFEGIMMLIQFGRYILAAIAGNRIALTGIVTMMLCMLNFIVLLVSMKKGSFGNVKYKKKSKEYKKKINNTLRNKGHVCSFCGITDKDNPDMEFRFCSRCDGNKEYCMDHLFTHEHIKKIVVNIDKDNK